MQLAVSRRDKATAEGRLDLGGAEDCWVLELLQRLEKFPALGDDGCNVGVDAKAKARRALQHKGFTPRRPGHRRIHAV